MVGIIIWAIVLYAAAQLDRFWPHGVILILGTSVGLLLVSLATAGNGRLGEPVDLSDPAVLGYNFLLKLFLSAFFVGAGFGIGKLFRWRAARKANEKSGE